MGFFGEIPMIKFYCSSCNQKLGVPDEYAGKRIRCNKCGQPGTVPRPEVVLVPAETKPQPVAAMAQSAPAQTKTPPSLNLELDNLPPLDPNIEAIQQASRQRASQIKVSAPASKTGSSRQTAAATEIAKGMGKIPLSLATCAAYMLGVIILWVLIAKFTGFIIGYVVIGVPVAGAWGLTRFTENRGIMLGLLAAILGFAGMLIAHGAVAKWVILPMLQNDTEFTESMNTAFSSKFSETAGQLTAEQVTRLAEEEDTMVFVAAMSLVNENQLTEDHVKQMFVYKMETEAAEDKNDVPASLPEVDNDYAAASKRLEEWDSDTRKQMLRQYYPKVGGIISQTFMEETKIGNAVNFFIAFVGSFGLLDLLWFPMGLYGAFKLASGMEGQE